MNIIAQKWGNSLAIRLPKYVVQKAKIAAGSPICIDVNPEGHIKITPLSQKEKLQQYLDQITDQNQHGEAPSTELSTESW